MRVALYFEGVVYVDIDADPEDDEAFTDALGQAWAAVSDNDISNAASLTEHEIQEVKA